MKRRMMGLAAVAAVLVLCGVWVAMRADAAEKKEAVDVSQLPAAVAKAIREAVPGGKVVSVEKEVEGEDPGQYDAIVRAGGKEYEVEISPAGEVLEVKQVAGAESAAEDAGKKWTDSFGEEDCTFATEGRNRFFILEPGYQLTLASAREKVMITVTDETRRIGKVLTRVIEEREEANGKLKEVSRNFFAICRQHGDVFYFGEEVDIYKDGRIVEHSGAWRADEKNSKAGIMMPGTVLLGARHYQEIAPTAMDRAEVVADDVKLTTPAGTFRNCIRVEETTPLEPGDVCYKIYAPGVGLIQDDDLLLTAVERR